LKSKLRNHETRTADPNQARKGEGTKNHKDLLVRVFDSFRDFVFRFSFYLTQRKDYHEGTK